MTAIYYDTEFLERGSRYPIDLISIGMVRGDGEEYYAVSSEFDQDAVVCHPWLRENVWAHLPTVWTAAGSRLDGGHPDVRNRQRIAAEVRAFVLGVPDPQLWAYYADYDHVVLCQLFGAMAGLPEGFPMVTWDLRQRMLYRDIRRDDLPEQDGSEHHALADARWVRDAMQHIDVFAR